MLEKYPNAGTPVLHWFLGSRQDIDRANGLGCWFSVGPAMLQSDRGRATVIRMPRDRVLTESDGPFAQLDGAPVLPWQVNEATTVLATLWGVPRTEVAETLQANLRRLVAFPTTQITPSDKLL